MTQKHFVAFAAMFASELASAETELERAAIARVAVRTADLFGNANARFNRARFYRAAGIA